MTVARAQTPPITSEAEAGPRLYDMHCHLDFLSEPQALAEEASRTGIGAFSTTVTPTGYAPAHAALADVPGFRIGLGAHPWWIADGRIGETDLVLFEQLAPDVPFIGEVGLDFTPRRASTFDAQASAFERIAAICASSGGKLLSLHAVRAADAVLDILERTGCLRTCRCVFHWFSCSSDELTRAVRAGCYFSINPRMFETKRGRAYARTIPPDLLLLETDEPPELDATLTCKSWHAELAGTLERLAELRQTAPGPRAAALSPAELGTLIAHTSEELLGL